MSDPTFSGNDEQRELAAEVYGIMVAQGTMLANDAPMRQTLTNLADFFASQRKTDTATIANSIDAALRENTATFAREEHDGEVMYVTSRKGAYKPRSDINTHMFPKRLYEPDNPLPIDDISVVVTTTRPALTTVEPVFISDYWQRQAGLTPLSDLVDGEAEPNEEAFAVAPEVLGEAELEPVAEAEIQVEAEAEAEPVAVEAEAEAEAEEAPVEAVELEQAQPAKASAQIALPNGVQVDLRRATGDLVGQYGPTLIAQLRTALENDPLRRIVSFGNDVYPEAQIANFGKNDMRRIREYINQEGEPRLDTQIISDVFYHNQRQNDYETFRFALNYRLSRDKDFEFVGVEGARLWSAKGLPSLGSKRVKASEMGQMAGYLEEGLDDSLQSQSADSIRTSGSLSHVLTFFEWEYGVLPFSRALATLLPGPLLNDQRTADIRFDSPQHHVSVLTELRFPTGNRGGWIAGLEGFFHEYLVPGALITLARTDEPYAITISYEEQPETSDRLLVLDEKKNKFAFANIAYYCAVDEDMLVNQQHYGRLRNLKSLPMNERRKSDTVLEHVFQIIGEPVGTRTEPRMHATESDLYTALNVLRPASTTYLQHLLRDGEYFEADESTPGAWFYNPPPKQSGDDDTDDDEYDDEYDDE